MGLEGGDMGWGGGICMAWGEREGGLPSIPGAM